MTTATQPVQDLSTRHGLITDLFRWPKSREEWQRYRLSDDQVAFFHENGFVGGIPVLDDRQVEALRADLARLMDPSFREEEAFPLFYEYHSNESGSDESVLFHALGAWRITPALHDVLWNPAFLVPAAQLLGGPVRFWHDQLFCKPAKHGGIVAWHQDYSYWTRTAPMQHLTCWMGLDDSTLANGAVHYVPGSHRWNLLPRTDLANNMDAIQGVLSDEQKAQFKPVPVETRKGEAIFHHPLALHGSYENRTDRPRRAVILNVFKDGTRSASDNPPLEGVPPVPTGERMDGQFFPLLLDPRKEGVPVGR